MARLDTTIDNEIDARLANLLAVWTQLPEIAEQAEQFSRWTEMERIDFIEEWPLNEAHLRRLQAHFRHDDAPKRQHERYKSLVGLIDRNRHCRDDISAKKR